jgi:hypothetical protein
MFELFTPDLEDCPLEQTKKEVGKTRKEEREIYVTNKMLNCKMG